MAETIISPGVFTRENDISFIQPAPVVAGAAIIGPTFKGPVELPTLVTSFNDYVRKFGSSFNSGSAGAAQPGVKEYFTTLAVRNYFSQGGGSVLVSRVVGNAHTSAASTFVTASNGSRSTPVFTFETIGKGEIYNNYSGSSTPTDFQNSDSSLISGSSDNIRWEISNVNSSLGTFTFSVRQGDDSLKNKVVLETFNNVSLDPLNANYIEKSIGNQTTFLATDSDGTKFIMNSGSFANKSNYIRIKSVNLPTPNYLQADGLTTGSYSSGFGYADSLPAAQSGGFHSATGNIGAGSNYFESVNNTNTQGLAGSDYSDIIGVLENKEEYQFNVISAPGLIYQNATQKGALDSIISLAETRGDCIAIIDLVNYNSTIGSVVTQAQGLNSSYAASYWPWVQMNTSAGLQFAPASVVIPGVYAFNDNSAAPWFAPAGLVRGGITGVIQAEKRLTRTQRDTLYSDKVNPIASFPGQGISVFGQKTLQTKASALDRVNVRRLLIELKKFIGDQARTLVFEQNTITTRNRFLATVNPFLESVVQRQGLFAFRVVMDDSNNTADVVDRNQLIGQIFIQPAKTAEFIVLDFTIEPTGATFAG
jgi:hypothetical protein